jgi:hypothetical protein
VNCRNTNFENGRLQAGVFPWLHGFIEKFKPIERLSIGQGA